MTSITVFVLSVFGWLAMLNAVVRAGTVLPQVSVIPARAYEGDSATTALRFRIAAIGPICGPITVDWATHDGSSTAPDDYTAASGTLALPLSDPVLAASIPVDGAFMGDIAVAPDGDIYTVDAALERVSRYHPDGTLVLSWGLGAANARGIAVDGAGNVYVAHVVNSRIEKYDSQGVYLRSFDIPGTPGPMTQPLGVAVDRENNVYASARGRIIKFDPDGNVLFERPTVDVRPEDLGIGMNGNIYVDVWDLNGNTSHIQVFTPDGDAVTVWDGTATAGRLWSSQLALDGCGHVFIADGTRIVVADESGNFITEWSNLEPDSSPVLYPIAIAADSAGNVYVTEDPSRRIVHYVLTAAADVVIDIHGDTAFEPSESFTLELSNAHNAMVVGATAEGTILNDDANVGPNVVTNSSFADSAGWVPYCGSPPCGVAWTLVPDGHNGPGAALVTGGDAGVLFGINDSPDWVSSAELEGARYRFSAWVKLVGGHGTARLRVREYSDSLEGSRPLQGTTQSSSVPLNGTWQRLTVAVLSVFQGSHLDFQVLMDPTDDGAQLLIDDVAIERLISDTPPVVLAPDLVRHGWRGPITVEVRAYDPDGDPIQSLTAQSSALPAGNNAAFTPRSDQSSGTWTWNPGSAASRNVPFVVTFAAANAQEAVARTFVLVTSNLADNGDFENTTDGWVGSRATLDTVPGRTGGHALRVTNTSDGGTFGVNDSPDRALSTGVGSDYTITAWIRTPSDSGQVWLWVREYDPEGQLLISDQTAPKTITSEWQRIRMFYRTRGVGSTLDFSVVMASTHPGDAFDVDDIDITAQRLVVAGVADPPDREITQFVSPNPMRDRGWLRLTTSRPGPLRARLYDLSGRVVRTLADETRAAAGEHSFALDRRDARGRTLAAGMYFYRVETADGARHGRFVILK